MYWIKCNQICLQSLPRQSYMKHVPAVSVHFNQINGYHGLFPIFCIRYDKHEIAIAIPPFLESSVTRLNIIFGRSVSQSVKLQLVYANVIFLLFLLYVIFFLLLTQGSKFAIHTSEICVKLLFSVKNAISSACITRLRNEGRAP